MTITNLFILGNLIIKAFTVLTFSQEVCLLVDLLILLFLCCFFFRNFTNNIIIAVPGKKDLRKFTHNPISCRICPLFSLLPSRSFLFKYAIVVEFMSFSHKSQG